MGCNHEESSTALSVLEPPQEQRRAGEDEDEEEEEELGEEEERREVEESSVEKGGAEASSLSSSLLHLSVLGRREAQRERLNKILLDLLHRTPSKNGKRKTLMSFSEGEAEGKPFYFQNSFGMKNPFECIVHSEIQERC